ncbi:Oidioi.mRNA.OKI2018_I69.chr2.g6308.t1.cds [Oikopleura dioica]|uniref:Oidioi.mRNA.OKI2018_I69.chr2.g6308.t1.cds n=1 Tax=Oikopleura dioica TaxID=34765 RepID=A0ABN7T9J6_OIKDI|nr:Oidioi.mRNA.OKI2018_I69.chr2.g6308.t1.cds [Oikopleura dioica]
MAVCSQIIMKNLRNMENQDARQPDVFPCLERIIKDIVKALYDKQLCRFTDDQSKKTYKKVSRALLAKMLNAFFGGFCDSNGLIHENSKDTTRTTNCVKAAIYVSVPYKNCDLARIIRFMEKFPKDSFLSENAKHLRNVTFDWKKMRGNLFRMQLNECTRMNQLKLLKMLKKLKIKISSDEEFDFKKNTSRVAKITIQDPDIFDEMNRYEDLTEDQWKAIWKGKVVDGPKHPHFTSKTCALFWQDSAVVRQFPKLSKIAIKLVSARATSCEAEREFARGSEYTRNSKRNRIKADTILKLRQFAKHEEMERAIKKMTEN